MKTPFSHSSLGARSARWIQCGMAVVAAAATLLAAAGAASAKPVITHDPVYTAVKGEPLGLRATVRDNDGRISSVSVFYASSRGMTPFRRDLSTTGADIWFGTIPGHLIGPGSNLFYYVHADNLEGDSTDTEWVTVNVIEPGISAAAMPTVHAVARQSQEAASATPPAPAPVSPSKAATARTPAAAPARTAPPSARTVAPSSPASAPVTVPAPAVQDDDESASGRNKYLLPVAIGVGAAAVVGGAIALASHHGGGGGSDGDGDGGGSAAEPTGTVTDGNYGGSFSICFEPSGTDSNAITHCDSGPVNLYVENGSVKIVGLWESEILTAPLSGNTFTAASALSARGDFPDANLIVAGNIGSSTASANVVGSSADPSNPGNFTGNISATRR